MLNLLDPVLIVGRQVEVATRLVGPAHGQVGILAGQFHHPDALAPAPWSEDGYLVPYSHMWPLCLGVPHTGAPSSI